MQTSEMKWAEWPLLNFYGLDSMQNKEVKSNFKILSFESISSILFMIGWPTLKKIFIYGPTIFKSNSLSQRWSPRSERREGEEKRNLLRNQGKQKKHLTDFEISELFEDNLKMLWTALEYWNIAQHFYETLDIKHLHIKTIYKKSKHFVLLKI